ncbi:MAG: hypothetical protein ACJ72H_22435 [Candidatus Sulfotelmatobacter sp.]|jgi:hypothetical protein
MKTSLPHFRHAAALIAAIACLSIPGMAQQSSFVLYDNFNRQFLDTNKWAPSSPCFTWTVLECVREIQNGQLRLAVRGTGATDSNSGNQYGESELVFKYPSRIKSISTQLTVRRTSAAACPASADFNSGTQVIIAGNFFNSGSGSSADDVSALLFFNHLPTDPPGVLTVIGLLSWQGQFFGGVGLGTVNVGQRITAKLIWEQRNHQFAVAWTDLASGTVTQTTIPYSIPDTTSAAVAYKSLGVRVFTPNCVGTNVLLDDTEAVFDNVRVGSVDE